MRQLLAFCFLLLTFISNTAYSNMLDIEKTTVLAEKGIVKEQYNLGYSYFYGKGVEPDKEKALYWLNKASKGNDGAVHYKIGRLYETGQVFPQNNEKAFQYYSMSAKSGDPYGTVNLSIMYLEGKGVQKNISEGIKWAEKAAKNGFVNAQMNLALLYSSRDKSVHDVEKATYWFGKAALNGNVLAQYEMGKHHLKGKNYDKAFEYFDAAVEGENTNAMIMLAMMFEQGLASEQSSEKSLKLLQLAYKLGNKKAGHYLKSYRTSNIKGNKSQPID